MHCYFPETNIATFFNWYLNNKTITRIDNKYCNEFKIKILDREGDALPSRRKAGGDEGILSGAYIRERARLIGEARKSVAGTLTLLV